MPPNHTPQPQYPVMMTTYEQQNQPNVTSSLSSALSLLSPSTQRGIGSRNTAQRTSLHHPLAPSSHHPQQQQLQLQQQQQQLQQPMSTTSRIEVMERVLFHLHTRTCNIGLAWTSNRTRRLFEHFLLVVAICCFGALITLHRSFVVYTDHHHHHHHHHHVKHNVTDNSNNYNYYIPGLIQTCLHPLPDFDPQSADITHLVILPHPGMLHHYDQGSRGTSDPSHRQQQESRVVWKRPRQTSLPPSVNYTTSNVCAANDEMICDERVGTNEPSGVDPWLEEQLRLLQNPKDHGGEVQPSLQVYYSYSTTKAYLMLPPDHPILDQLHVQYVLVSPTDPRCFGEPFLQFLIWNCFIGPDTILLNWLLTFEGGYAHPRHEDNNNYNENTTSSSTGEPPVSDTATSSRRIQHGYAYNPRTQRLQELNPIGRSTTKDDGIADNNNLQGDRYTGWTRILWRRIKFATLLSKVGVLLQTSFLFFICTTLVSFTLRETQERMLDFTRELSRRVQQSLPVSDLITTHLVQNLVFVPIMVGMMFFLIEFYGGDKYLAFSVSSIVWCAEAFSIISLRSCQGLQYFPKFFFLLFLLFHVYQLTFRETGFVYCALTVMWCFILHSMVFFWHRYELPAVALGYVTVDRPRMVRTTTTQQRGNAPNINNNNTNNTTSHTDTGQDTMMDLSSSNTARQHQSSDGASDGDVMAATPDRLAMTNEVGLALSTSATMTTTSTTTQQQHSSTTGTTVGTTVPSHPSFSTTSSSRNISGLFRNNHDDDGSTGSLLYFMGGEVVVHRSDGTGGGGHTVNNNTSTRPTTSFVSGGGGTDIPILSRDDSILSMRSSSWDTGHEGTETTSAIGSGDRAEVGMMMMDSADLDSSRSSSCNHHQHDNNSNYYDDSDEFAAVLTVPSIETVPWSNRTPKKGDNNGNTRDYPTNDLMDYEHESGGLRAILETRLTPRHSNTQQQQVVDSRRRTEQDGGRGIITERIHYAGQEDVVDPSSSADAIQQPILDGGNINGSSTVLQVSGTNINSNRPYQRTPPTFPELPDGGGRRWQ